MRHEDGLRHASKWIQGAIAALLVCAGSPALAATSDEASIFLDLQPLTRQQRLEDFAWVVGNFEEFYAPLNYKEERWGFAWDKLVADYKARVSRPMNHRKFAAVMQQFVSEVRDAHTSLASWREAKMDGGDMRVSTLGFHTKRMLVGGKDGFYVASILPGFFAGVAQPVVPGDQIVAIDGRPVELILKEDLQPYQTTGREDSDATVLARSLAFRVSSMWPLRPKGAVDVMLVRDNQLRRVHLDWVDASLSEIYMAERARAGDTPSAATALAQTKVVGKSHDNRWIVQVDRRPGWRHLMQAEQSSYPDVEHQFFMQPHVAFYNAVGQTEADQSQAPGAPITVDGLPFRLMKTERGLAAVYRVEDFVFSRLRCGKPTTIDENLAFGLCDELTGEDYAKAFNKLADMGVSDLVLDLRRNGGGMLAFSDNLLRAFASEGIPAQSATVRVNESWLGEFVALGGGGHPSLAARTVYRDQEKQLRRDIADKRRVSTPVHLQGQKTLTANPQATQLRTHVLIDELCASACDLFAAAMQDNHLATILGRRSMGAGGNVVSVGMSPHEKLALTQTASLIYRANGSFVENEGVTPDIDIPAHLDAEVWRLVLRAIGRGI